MNTKDSVIRDLIIPLNRYPHLNENQTLEEAIQTFMAYRTGSDELLRYSLLLVVDDNHHLVGKLTLVNIMHALAPRLLEATKVKHFEGKQTEYPNLAFLYEHKTFADCGENQKKPIKPLLQPIEFTLSADTYILKAIVMMSHRNDYNVPVTDNGAIVGMLRLEEIFNALCETYCNIKQ